MQGGDHPNVIFKGVAEPQGWVRDFSDKVGISRIDLLKRIDFAKHLRSLNINYTKTNNHI